MTARTAVFTEHADRAVRFPRATIWLLLVLVPLVHLPLRHSEYIQDDHLAVETNSVVARGDLAEIFSTSYWAGAQGDDRSLYRPAVILSFALERRIVGEPEPLLSQTLNVLLHLGVVLLLLALTRRLRADPLTAGIAALVFAVHPVHVEAIANIVGRAELLATGAGLGSLWLLSWSGAWFESAGPRPAAMRLAAWGAAGCLFVALCSKEVALALLPLMVVFELLFRPRGRGFPLRSAAALAPSALAVTIYLVLRVRALETLTALQPAHPFDNVLVQLSGPERLATALALIPRYAGLLFYPVRLTADYSGPVIPVSSGLLEPMPLLGIVLLVCLIGLALLPWRLPESRRARLAAFAASMILFPYWIIGNLFFAVGTVFGERLIYMSSVGFSLLLGMVIAIVARPAGRMNRDRSAKIGFPVASLALAAILVAFATLSWARCLDWRNDTTLFEAAIRTRPASPRAQFIVGSLAARAGRLPEALDHLDRAVDAYPRYDAAWFERGVVLGRLGRLSEAERSFRRAIEWGPARAAAHLNLGITLRRLGRSAEAERSLRRALLWDPGLPRAWASLGHLFLERGSYDDAVRAYRRAIALGRTDLDGPLARAEEGRRRMEDP